MSCFPTYAFRPNFIASPTPCTAPVYPEHRSRLTAGGAFFRSIEQGQDRNHISLELFVVPSGPSTDDVTLVVRYNGQIVETFMVTQTTVTVPTTSCNGIVNLRKEVNINSEYIEMPRRGFDVRDPLFGDPMADDGDGCLGPFNNRQMRGANGEPDVTNLSLINSIRTGPTRTIIIISTTEGNDGSPLTPPTDERVRQFNGNRWISYQNFASGACPLDG